MALLAQVPSEVRNRSLEFANLIRDIEPPEYDVVDEQDWVCATWQYGDRYLMLLIGSDDTIVGSWSIGDDIRSFRYRLSDRCLLEEVGRVVCLVKAITSSTD